MALPQTVRVKLSSEVAEAISITPVVLQELPVRELVEHLLGIAGKDESRIREILRRGTLVSGASRFRWAGWEADLESLREGASRTDGVIHLAFNHDFSRFEENREQDRRAIEAIGAVLEGSARPLLVTSGVALLVPGRTATEADVATVTSASYPRNSD